jgi:ABC-type spermidine/putrescine transport system permease subunit I
VADFRYGRALLTFNKVDPPRSNWHWILPALLFIGALHAAPILRLIWLSFGEAQFELGTYRDLFGLWSYGSTLLRTVRISAWVVVGCILWGFPIAYVLAFARPSLRIVLWILVLVPSWASVLVRNFSWLYLLRDGGVFSTLIGWMMPSKQPAQLIYNEIGVVIAMVGTLLPFMVYPIYLSLSSQPPAVRSAAASLGASPFRVFTSVTLPLSAAGLRAGSILVFVTSAGFFVTPALLGGGRVLTAATFIDQQITEFLDWRLAAAASAVLLLIVAASAALYPRSKDVRS